MPGVKLFTRVALIGSAFVVATVAMEGPQGLVEAAPAARDNRQPWAPDQATIDRGRTAVSDFLGKDVRSELIYVREMPLGPFEGRLLFRVAKTGKEFQVRERDWWVVKWNLGTALPDVSGIAAPTQEYQRRLLSRYYTEVPVGRMALATEASVRGGSEYEEVSPNGTVIGFCRCKFTWNPQLTHLKSMIRVYSPVHVDLKPRLSRAKAEKIAKEFVSSWPNVTGVRIRNSLPGVKKELLVAATANEDDGGVQRLMYWMYYELKRPNESLTRAGVVKDELPRNGPVYVDAHTGACFAPWAQTFWPAYLTRDRLVAYIADRDSVPTMLDLQYQARLLEGHVYMCAYYLQSWIWPGTVDFDRHTLGIKVTYRGQRWRSQVDSRELAGNPGVVRTDAPVRLIESVPYLPASMIERVTGWKLTAGGDALMGRTVLLTPPR